MALAVKWGIENTNFVEEEGVVTSYVAVFRAYDVANTYGDARTLQEALDASGMPQQGDPAPGNTNLRMHRRTVTPVAGSPTDIIVECEYKTVADWEDSFILSVAGGVNSRQTSTDIFGNVVSLAYTYPGSYPIPDLQGETLSTAANESVLEPQMTLTGTGTLLVAYPLQIVQSWLWHVNSAPWAGWAPGHWLCTACEATPRDIGVGRFPKKWRFRWSFEFKLDGWPVVAKIVDPNTGITPPDAVPGVGIKPVIWYPSRDFRDIFWDT